MAETKKNHKQHKNMDDKHRSVLRSRHSTIIEVYGDNPDIFLKLVDYLLSTNVLTKQMHQEIICEKDSYTRVRTLMRILPKRGCIAFATFMDGILATNSSGKISDGTVPEIVKLIQELLASLVEISKKEENEAKKEEEKEKPTPPPQQSAIKKLKITGNDEQCAKSSDICGDGGEVSGRLGGIPPEQQRVLELASDEYVDEEEEKRKKAVSVHAVNKDVESYVDSVVRNLVAKHRGNYDKIVEVYPLSVYTIKDSDCKEMVNHMGSNWFILGLFLHLTHDRLTQIGYDNPRDCKMASYTMLTEWLSKRGDKTLQTLFKADKEAGSYALPRDTIVKYMLPVAVRLFYVQQ